MAGVDGNISSEIIKNVVSGLSPQFAPIIGILKAVGIIVLIYLVILIVKAILNIRTGFKIGKIAKNVEEINQKLDILTKGKKKK